MNQFEDRIIRATEIRTQRVSMAAKLMQSIDPDNTMTPTNLILFIVNQNVHKGIAVYTAAENLRKRYSGAQFGGKYSI